MPIHVVSGTERTGTSMMMYALIEGRMSGVYCKSNIKQYSFNPNGLYETTGSILPNMLKADGKVIKVFGRELINVDYYFETGLKIVYMIRNPEEIYISHKIMDKSYTISKIKNEISKDLLLRRDKKEKNIIKNLPKERKDIMTFDVFDYNWVVENPIKAFTKLKERGWNINIDKSSKTINPKYCHSKYYQDFYKKIKV